MNQVLLAMSFGMLLLTPAPALFAQTTPAGHWEGNVVLPNQEMTISVDLAKNDKGAWTGSFGVPTQGVTGLKIDKLEVDGKNVKFTVPEAPGAPEFSGAVKDDGHMALSFSANGASFPADLKRTGEAKVELPQTSPVVDAKFEGDWEGSLVTPPTPENPSVTLRIAIHLHNQPDKTVKATLDSPDQNAFGMSMSDVVQKDLAIEMKLKMVGGAYKGVLNAEGTELAGDWSQGGGTLPLKLKKATK